MAPWGAHGRAMPEDHGREAARLAVAMLHAREAPAGPMEVVLAAGESGILLHEAVGHGLEADFNRKQTSNYSGQIGKKVASDLCTVVDDATITGARGSINVDDGGVAGGQAEFAQLAGVSAGAKQVDQERTAFFWISISWPMPTRANAMRRAI